MQSADLIQGAIGTVGNIWFRYLQLSSFSTIAALYQSYGSPYFQQQEKSTKINSFRY
jgi:hypothetical protein